MTDRLPNGRFRNDAPRPASGTPAGGSGYGGGKRGAGTPFAPGNRPDPERRLEGKIKAGVARALAAGHVPAAVEVWREVMMDRAAPPAARVAAAEKMVERAEGKPEQPVSVSPLDGITNEQLAAAISALTVDTADDPEGGAGEESGAE